MTACCGCWTECISMFVLHLVNLACETRTAFTITRVCVSFSCYINDVYLPVVRDAEGLPRDLQTAEVICWWHLFITSSPVNSDVWTRWRKTHPRGRRGSGVGRDYGKRVLSCTRGKYQSRVRGFSRAIIPCFGQILYFTVPASQWGRSWCTSLI